MAAVFLCEMSIYVSQCLMGAKAATYETEVLYPNSLIAKHVIEIYVKNNISSAANTIIWL